MTVSQSVTNNRGAPHVGRQREKWGAHQKNFGRRFAPALCPPLANCFRRHCPIPQHTYLCIYIGMYAVSGPKISNICQCTNGRIEAPRSSAEDAEGGGVLFAVQLPHLHAKMMHSDFQNTDTYCCLSLYLRPVSSDEKPRNAVRTLRQIYCIFRYY